MKNRMKKIGNFLLAVAMLLMLSYLSGCQVDFDGGMYRTPRVSTKLLYKGADETENHARSRDTGTFGTGNSFGMVESPTDNRQGWGLGSKSGTDKE